MSNNTDFFNTHSCKHLLQKHSLTETGLWKILGEDPNCDMGGSHHQPDLGIVEGKLADVIAYAVTLPNFWQWGAGGNIKKISNIKKIDSETIKRLALLKEEKQNLLNRLEEINKELGE